MTARNPAATAASTGDRPRLVFVANCLYSDIVSGGDIHTFNMARGALEAGYPLHFFGGHALQEQLAARGFAASLTLTDRRKMHMRDFNAFAGQVSLSWDWQRRLWGALCQRREIRPEDIVYANTDFWFDSLPTMFCPARRKLMILGMDAPTARDIWRKARPDVQGHRLNSVHYWLSQNLSLRLFRRYAHKRLLYVHPAMKPRLLRLGYRERELVYVSNGMDLREAEAVPEQPKQYDVAWLGRVHPQKGIEDLLATLVHLSKTVTNFCALMIGNVKAGLDPRVQALGLASRVTYSGRVSEAEKFRLLKSSRVFLMPSRYESWGIVMAEALVCGVPVVAYDIAAYRPVFGDLVCYVPPFDREAFQQSAAEQVTQTRAGRGHLAGVDLSAFKRENSWQAAAERFLGAVRDLEAESA